MARVVYLIQRPSDRLHYYHYARGYKRVRTFSVGWTPLMRVAAVSGNVNVAKVLIHHGANVHTKDKEGKTTLMNAALNGFEALVKLLVKKGVSVKLKSEHRKTALDFARSFERERVIQFLQEQEEALKKADNERKLAEAKERRQSREQMDSALKPVANGTESLSMPVVGGKQNGAVGFQMS